MIVIDVGAAKHGGDESIPYLIEEFKPDVLYGFDPAYLVGSVAGQIGKTQVFTSRSAAWLYEGEVGFSGDGLRGHVDDTGEPVHCFDLSRFILALPDEPVVLKLDAEGAEYALIPHLIAQGADLRLQLAWIEWHCPMCGTGWFGNNEPDTCARCWHIENGKRTDLEAALRCDVHQWNR